ncbi:hypothetical protein Mapa_010275 [Marchantia paleacea]|nr:hypothetical protein Mapa_010275 [Marchantia paleacea]
MEYKPVIRGPKFVETMPTPRAANPRTKTQAEVTDKSPAATGKKGLFTLSMPTS